MALNACYAHRAFGGKGAEEIKKEIPFSSLLAGARGGTISTNRACHFPMHPAK